MLQTNYIMNKNFLKNPTSLYLSHFSQKEILKQYKNPLDFLELKVYDRIKNLKKSRKI